MEAVDPFCIKRDDNYLWILAPEYEPNDLEGKDASSGQGKEEPPTVDDVSATIEHYLGELDLPLAKTALVEKLRDRIPASKAKIISALDDLCKKGVLETRKGDYAEKKQASKLFCHGPNSPFYQPPEKTSDSSE